MQKQKQKVNLNKIISTIIIALAVGLALYIVTNGFTNGSTDNTENVGQNYVELEDELDEDPELLDEEDEQPVITIVAPTLTEAEASLHRSLLFFIDKNENGTREDGEEICKACSGRSVVLARPANSAGIISTLISVNVPNTAKVSEIDIAGSNQTWAIINDRSVIVTPQKFAFGDGVSDINIAVQEVTGVVSAVNANVEQANEVGGSVVYNLSRLIPTMKTAFDNQNQVWIKYTPNIAKSSEYYMASTKLQMLGEIYTATVNWSMAPDKSNANKLENIEFVIK